MLVLAGLATFGGGGGGGGGRGCLMGSLTVICRRTNTTAPIVPFLIVTLVVFQMGRCHPGGMQIPWSQC